jgi:hypothetical protein
MRGACPRRARDGRAGTLKRVGSYQTCESHHRSGIRILGVEGGRVESERSFLNHDCMTRDGCTNEKDASRAGLFVHSANIGYNPELRANRVKDSRKQRTILLASTSTVVCQSKKGSERNHNILLFPGAQFQRFNCSSGASTYRPPFLGYFSNSCATSARSSVDSSTSPACRFSNVRFMFLRRTGHTQSVKK